MRAPANPFSEAEVILMQTFYPVKTNAELEQIFKAAGYNRNQKTFLSKAQNLGLTKTSETRHRRYKVQKNQTKYHKPIKIISTKKIIYPFRFRRDLKAQEIIVAVSHFIDSGGHRRDIAYRAGLSFEQYQATMQDGCSADKAGGLAKVLGIER